jgi:phosphinothricin acetyltransferase
MTIDIRLARIDDAADILAIYAPYCESSTVTFETVAPTRAEMAGRIARVVESYPWIVAEVDGQILGYVYGTRFRERAAYRWTAEAAVYVALNHQRRGLARALYTSLFSILRHQGYSKVIAGVTLPNAASVQLHEKMGFQKVGHFPGVGFKSADWLDVGWWQLSLAEQQDRPPDPRPFPSVRNDAEIALALDEGRRLANRRV